MVTIKTKYGYSVECFGECNEYATIDAVFDNEWFDGLVTGVYKNWTDAVNDLADYANERGTGLMELSSDS